MRLGRGMISGWRGILSESLFFPSLFHFPGGGYWKQELMTFLSNRQMNARCGLGQALCASLNWDPPFKDPPTRKELARMEYERESAEQHGANRPAFEESPASRSIRVFIGYKNGDEMMRI
jgi:hypothetical protein